MSIEKSLSIDEKIVSLTTEIIILLYWLNKLQPATLLLS